MMQISSYFRRAQGSSKVNQGPTCGNLATPRSNQNSNPKDSQKKQRKRNHKEPRFHSRCIAMDLIEVV